MILHEAETFVKKHKGSDYDCARELKVTMKDNNARLAGIIDLVKTIRGTHESERCGQRR